MITINEKIPFKTRLKQFIGLIPFKKPRVIDVSSQWAFGKKWYPKEVYDYFELTIKSDYLKCFDDLFWKSKKVSTSCFEELFKEIVLKLYNYSITNTENCNDNDSDNLFLREELKSSFEEENKTKEENKKDEVRLILSEKKDSLGDDDPLIELDSFDDESSNDATEDIIEWAEALEEALSKDEPEPNYYYTLDYPLVAIYNFFKTHHILSHGLEQYELNGNFRADFDELCKYAFIWDFKSNTLVYLYSFDETAFFYIYKEWLKERKITNKKTIFLLEFYLFLTMRIKIRE